MSDYNGGIKEICGILCTWIEKLEKRIEVLESNSHQTKDPNAREIVQMTQSDVTALGKELTEAALGLMEPDYDALVRGMKWDGMEMSTRIMNHIAVEGYVTIGDYLLSNPTEALALRYSNFGRKTLNGCVIY